jgi:hypothetical protein
MVISRLIRLICATLQLTHEDGYLDMYVLEVELKWLIDECS